MAWVADNEGRVEGNKAAGSNVDMGLSRYFSGKELEEVRAIFADNSYTVLMATSAVSLLHLIFDFLAFKNDVSFWRQTNSLPTHPTTIGPRYHRAFRGPDVG